MSSPPRAVLAALDTHWPSYIENGVSASPRTGYAQTHYVLVTGIPSSTFQNEEANKSMFLKLFPTEDFEPEVLQVGILLAEHARTSGSVAFRSNTYVHTPAVIPVEHGESSGSNDGSNSSSSSSSVLLRNSGGQLFITCSGVGNPVSAGGSGNSYAALFEGIAGRTLYDIMHDKPKVSIPSSVSVPPLLRKGCFIAHIALATALARFNIACKGWKSPQKGVRILAGFDDEASSSTVPNTRSIPTDPQEFQKQEMALRVCAWDFRHALTVHKPAVPEVQEEKLRILLTRVFHEFEATVKPLYDASEERSSSTFNDDSSANPSFLRRWWIHGDANDCNVFVRDEYNNHNDNSGSGGHHNNNTSTLPPSSSPSSSSVSPSTRIDPQSLTFIDFDDVSYSYLVHDPVISLTYLMMGREQDAEEQQEEDDDGGESRSQGTSSSTSTTPVNNNGAMSESDDILYAAAAFIKAYTSLLPLNRTEVSAILPLIRCRLGISLLSSARAVAKAPERAEYILLHAAPARRLLEWTYGALERKQPTSTNKDIAGTTAASTTTRESRMNDEIHVASFTARVQQIWQTAADEGEAIRKHSGGASNNTYIPYTLESLSEEQRVSSTTVIAALQELGQNQYSWANKDGIGKGTTTTTAATTDGSLNNLGKVMNVPRSSASPSAAAIASNLSLDGQGIVTKAGYIPTKRAWGIPGDADDKRWPSIPFVYDFSPTASKSLLDVVGTDPEKLAKFTDMMFAPLMMEPKMDVTEATTSSEASIAADGAGSATSIAHSSPARLGWGKYFEERVLYQSEHFIGSAAAVEARTLHLGVDLEAPPGTPLFAPLPGVVHSWARNTAELDYGPTIILQHIIRCALDGSNNTSNNDNTDGVVSAKQPELRSMKNNKYEVLEGDDLISAISAMSSSSNRNNDRLFSFFTLYGHMSMKSIYTNAGTDAEEVKNDLEYKHITSSTTTTTAAPTSTSSSSSSSSSTAAVSASPLLHGFVYRHSLFPRVVPGKTYIPRGGVVGWVGGPEVNGGWPPHVHFQIQTELQSMGGWVGDYPGVCAKSHAPAYALLTPDPNLILRCPWIAPVGGWEPVAK